MFPGSAKGATQALFRLGREDLIRFRRTRGPVADPGELSEDAAAGLTDQQVQARVHAERTAGVERFGETLRDLAAGREQAHAASGAK